MSSPVLFAHPTVLYDAVLTRIDAQAGVLVFSVAQRHHCVRSSHLSWWTLGAIGRLTLPVEGLGFSFFPYPDQRLRRAPDRDDLRRERWGWRVAKRRFTAKAGIVPGKDGALASKDTEGIQLELPREFLDFCSRRKIPPDQLLRGFVADLCELMNWCSCPREDGYCSN